MLIVASFKKYAINSPVVNSKILIIVDHLFHGNGFQPDNVEDFPMAGNFKP
jgi:hypothetical protein